MYVYLRGNQHIEGVSLEEATAAGSSEEETTFWVRM